MILEVVGKIVFIATLASLLLVFIPTVRTLLAGSVLDTMLSVAKNYWWILPMSFVAWRKGFYTPPPYQYIILGAMLLSALALNVWGPKVF